MNERSTKGTVSAFKLCLVVIFYFALIVSRIIWPNIKIDEITVTLAVIATIFMMLPELISGIESIKSIKYKDIEISFNKEYESLKKADQAVKSDKQVGNSLKRIMEQSFQSELNDVIYISKINIKSAIAMLSSKIEKRLFQAIKEDEGHWMSRRKTATGYVVYGASVLKLWPQQVVDMFGYFWQIRNMIIHDEKDKLIDEKLQFVLDIGIDMYKIIWYATKNAES